MAQHVLAPSNTGRNHRAGCGNTEIKTRAASRTLLSCECSWRELSASVLSPASRGPDSHSKMRVRDSWQASRRRETPLAEKIQKWELRKFIFYSCFIVVKGTASTQIWEYEWVQGSDSGSKRCSFQSFPVCQQTWFFSNTSYSVILSLPSFCLFGFRMNQALKSLTHVGFPSFNDLKILRNYWQEISLRLTK